ncbi:hypothetical protein GW17_00058486 [Ensete ventricosum]|nr:hypothetical protein GW17_00058486 [Ensete ventricosum]
MHQHVHRTLNLPSTNKNSVQRSRETPFQDPLGHGDGEQAVLHCRPHLLQTGVLRQPKPPQEPAAFPSHAVPGVVGPPAPFGADSEDPPVLHLHPHVLLLQLPEVGPEHVHLRRPFPVDAGADEKERVREEEERKGRPSNGSHGSMEKASRTLFPQEAYARPETDDIERFWQRLLYYIRIYLVRYVACTGPLVPPPRSGLTIGRRKAGYAVHGRQPSDGWKERVIVSTLLAGHPIL